VNNNCEQETVATVNFWLKRGASAYFLTVGKGENSLFQKIKENNIC
jgi:hypothetical protein